MNNQSVQSPKDKPPYLFGLLCLIPLIGAFVGIAILLYGIIKYKDKWFILIGIFGIIFTVFVYGSLFYMSKHTGVFKKGVDEMSMNNMNALVRDVEFYKLQIGEYPDSLQEIENMDIFKKIYDPTQTDKKNDTYNYKKMGNYYTIFSSGEDGIPYTKDDIYPDIVVLDTSKIGFRIFKH